MIIDRFEEQVKKHPNHLAVKTGSDELSYQKLNHHANAVARAIIDRCDVSGEACQTVALLFGHGNDMIVGMIGALKAAKICVPLDPHYPTNLLAYMLKDSEANFIITNDEFVEYANLLIQESNREAKIINTDKVITIDSQEFTNFKCEGDEIAYILYTSGSTGKPKGVMQSHRNVLHFAECLRSFFKITPEDRVTLLSSFSFDGGIGDIYATLLNGASLYPLDVKSGISIDKLADWLKAERISIWHSVPTLYRHFIDTISESDVFPSLRLLWLGGERVLFRDINTYKENFPDAKFAISYGMSESSINSIQIYTPACQIEEITLGEPVQETEIVVVNENQEEVLPLSIGEIVIISDYIALGYWKDELKSKEVFRNIPGIGRTYWTGDLGRLLADGNIEIIGRKDFQVKIRGFRIEMGGIENQLVGFVEVKEAVVTACEDDLGDKYLCAYIVADENISVSELRDRLSESLPDYMIPSYFVRMEQLPLTPSGKVNRKALPKPSHDIELGYVAPRNAIEEMLAQIWSEVLNRERVGINDNFFELGGHSLKATMMISRIHKELNVELQLKELFTRPTIAELSSYIADVDKSVYAAIEVAEAKEYYETSYTQKRMWAINQLNLESPMFNMPGRVTLLEEVDSIIIQKIFDKLSKRHEAFRTRFEERDGVIVQIIEEEMNLIVETIDLANLSPIESKQERIRVYEKLAAKIFDLREGRLIDVKLIKVNEREYDLIFCMHHIISDGWSLDVLKKEFFANYEAYKHQKEYKPHPLRIQYKDFAQWQNRLIENEQFSEDAKRFWTGQLDGEISTLNLPIKYQINDIGDKTGSAYKIVLQANIKDKLKEQAYKFPTSLFIILLTTFITFLSELTKQDDILIGMPTFGRDHEDLQRVIGCFVNTTILRNKINQKDSFIEVLKKIEQNTLDALQYQNYPLELITEQLNIKYPKISAFFNMLNFAESASEDIKDLNPRHTAKTRDVKFDLEWYVTEYLNGIEINCVYNAGLFKPKRIEYIMSKYIDYVKKVAKNPDKQLKDYFAEGKRRQF